MYVFVDMEWISNQRGNHWPTQLAAARVDAHWNTVDTLSTLFRPKDFSFQQWGHMAFSGWNSVRLEQFYVAGNLADFEKLLKAPYQNEYYVTRNQIAAYESHEIDDICDYLTVHEVLELPYTARSEYVLYRWNDVFDNAEKIRSMVDRLRFQVECFNEALPYEAGQSYGDRAASQVRVIYRIS